jgi:hypothetical protein
MFAVRIACMFAVRGAKCLRGATRARRARPARHFPLVRQLAAAACIVLSSK